MNKPRRLSGIVKNVSDPIFGKKSMLYSELISNWDSIAGEEVSSYALPLELKFKRTGGKHNTAVLKLAVTSARSQDIMMQKDLLIEKLNQFMGFQAIEDIQLVHRPHKDIRKKAAYIRTKRPLSQQETASISGRLAGIENEDLKNALQSFGMAVYSGQNSQEALENKD